MPLAARGTVPLQQRNRGLDQALGQFLRVADGGGGEDELRPGSIELCHPLQPADHVGEMRTEYTPVGVHLINDYESQVAEKVRPIGVVGQDAGMQHVGVGEDDIAVLADGGTMRLGGVAIVDR